ncbi:MAG: DUF3108 domain-containing protein [Cyclobacteriaceae bacterium]|nr:DUF3108 domain-containing protein [Cyclobacteriaceae bacterium]
MMKKTLIYIMLILVFSAFQSATHEAEYIPVNNDSFGLGEEVVYKMNFGVFTVGKGKIKIHPTIHNVNYRGCYRIDIWGKTSGMVDWLAQVDDNWGAYVDTAALVPHIEYRRLKEGNYRRNEIVKFDHSTDNIEVKLVDKNTGKFKEPMYYAAPDNVRSILSGLLYMRSLSLDTVNVGDTLNIDGFFEDSFYDMDIIYDGKGKLKTKAGNFNAIKLVPVVPDNKIFNGENSITAWFSDDKNRIPLKVEADMFIGSAGVEIISFKGLRNPVNAYME